MPRGLWILGASVLVLGCASFPRRLGYFSMQSPALRDVVAQYAVLAPVPRAGGESLPLVVFLHGGGDGPDAFDRHGLSAQLEAAMAEGRLPRAVFVLPQGDLGFWANWYDGSRRYEDWVVDEVMPTVARRERTRPCPEGCHLMGVSMGAEGALRIALHRAGTFASVTSISGPTLDTARRMSFMRDPLINIILPTLHIFGPLRRAEIEADDPFVRWRAPADLGAMRLYIAWAEGDRGEIREGGAAFVRHLVAHGIPHHSEVFPGRHDWVSWAPVIQRALAVQLAP